MSIIEKEQPILLHNAGIELEIDPKSGLICVLRSPLGAYNLADRRGLGGVRYTLKGEDARTGKPFIAYADHLATYDRVVSEGAQVLCENSALGIRTLCRVEEDGLYIESRAENEQLSAYGIDLNFNLIGKKNGGYLGQLLPSSPYTTGDGKWTYFILPVIGAGFCAVVSRTPGLLWKLDYSSDCWGHYINGLQILSSTDRLYGAEGPKQAAVQIVFARTQEECFDKIQRLLGLPMLLPRVTGTFGRQLTVNLLGPADQIRVVCGDQETTVYPENGQAVIPCLGYGRHQLIPYMNGQAGLDTQVWFGDSVKALFERSCDTITGFKHGDDNLCEGMIWCWSMLCCMNLYGVDKYLPRVKDALKIVMCEGEEPRPRQSIVPYALDGNPPYHLFQSDRVQEQFFGVSLLLDMYRLTGEERYLEYAVSSAKAVLEKYQRADGGIFRHAGSDYTTVCAPIIPIVDLALLFQDRDAALHDYFAGAARRIVEHLMRRDLHFPTEGEVNDLHDEEMEEGSISCTALSVLYYCRYIERRQEYIDFAEKVLRLHENWVIRTPDVRMYRSTMRWWETIWEGDARGPSICAGHAWAIWRAEADYHMGVLTGKAEYFEKSLNGFMSNLSKITAEGESYSCYQPDFITGGGDVETRSGRKALRAEDPAKTYDLMHNYPRHYDDSLSRYVWTRACATWLKDAPPRGFEAFAFTRRT